MRWGYILFSACFSACFVTQAFAVRDCDCTQYPFKPNPPCYGVCVKKLSGKGTDFSSIKGIDPGVELGIKVISEGQQASSIDFASIKGKPDLEREALKSMKGKEFGPGIKDYDKVK